MKQYYVISEAMDEDKARLLAKFLNKTSYIEADFNLMVVDTMED